MKKLLYAFAAIALLAEPVVAMPVNPAPVAPTVSEGQIVTAAYGHYRRVARRSTRRVIRRHY